MLAYFYLLISIAGAIFPTLANVRFAKTYGPGFDFAKFIDLATSNAASQSLSFDLLFLASAIFLWMYVEARRLNIRYFWLVALGTFTIAIGFSAPFFLFLRERRLYEIENENLPNS
ncbi:MULTISPECIES: DUF2834 domain-containing protein [unclassified Prochlorococcus]|uniref:DUF2834 domain-containing protein n=1 Tax=unclassified Prochlorococcus TaxID=2627481 RepID=UPI000533AC76|nr:MULTISPECIES: DUF2834 domain-containing protein [unclassified Prochlorococcus]KGG15484.1 hypothetical protein EV06_1356 [Prochlorococcus sp. MIT 0602]KGG17764.1 hypothetical protein EV07_1204 [Prochlorococcus sp. MIT 0603]